jgi:hypothetical protein
MTSNPHLREDDAPHDGMGAVLMELAQQLAAARDRYDELVEWRAANAATTELASDHRLNHKPFYYERNGWRPGKLLKGQPKADTDYVEDFFDDSGRWIATCEHTVPVQSVYYYEEFFERSDTVVYGTRFDSYAPDKKPINASRASFSGDLIVDHAIRGQEGWLYEIYRRDDRGRVVTIECARFQPLYHQQPAESTVQIEYDEDGLLSIRETWRSGGKELLYRR